jgi:hypothetical protein
MIQPQNKTTLQHKIFNYKNHKPSNFGIFDHAAFQRHGAQFVRRTAAWPHGNPPKFQQK